MRGSRNTRAVSPLSFKFRGPGTPEKSPEKAPYSYGDLTKMEFSEAIKVIRRELRKELTLKADKDQIHIEWLAEDGVEISLKAERESDHRGDGTRVSLWIDDAAAGKQLFETSKVALGSIVAPDKRRSGLRIFSNMTAFGFDEDDGRWALRLTYDTEEFFEDDSTVALPGRALDAIALWLCQ